MLISKYVYDTKSVMYLQGDNLARSLMFLCFFLFLSFFFIFVVLLKSRYLSGIIWVDELFAQNVAECKRKKTMKIVIEYNK